MTTRFRNYTIAALISLSMWGGIIFSGMDAMVLFLMFLFAVIGARIGLLALTDEDRRVTLKMRMILFLCGAIGWLPFVSFGLLTLLRSPSP